MQHYTDGNCYRTYNLCRVSNVNIPTRTGRTDLITSVPTTPESSTTTITDNLTNNNQNIDLNTEEHNATSGDISTAFDVTTTTGTTTEYPLTTNEVSSTNTNFPTTEKTSTEPDKQTTGEMNTDEDPVTHVSDLTIPMTTNEIDTNTSEATTLITTVDPTSNSKIDDLTTKPTHQDIEKIATESNALTTGDTAIEDITNNEKIDCEVKSSKERKYQECTCPACECEITTNQSLQSTQKSRKVSDSVATFSM